MASPNLTHEEFMIRVKLKHGDRYDYSITKYVSYRDKLKINCRVCGVFEITPPNHIKGSGCRKCGLVTMGRKLRTRGIDFVAQASVVHGNKYIYKLTKYKGSFQKVDIECPQHGVFSQVANDHLKGAGCPYCSKSGFCTETRAYLYVVTDGELCKVGISNNSSRNRLKTLIRVSGRPFKEIFRIEFETGAGAKELEALTLSWLREKYVNPEEKFDGYTECFYNVNIADLLSEIEQHKGTTWKTTM